MNDYFYERLSPQDRSFLVFETPTTHMHVGGVTVFEGGSLATRDGGVNGDLVRAYIASRLHWIPRYLQRLSHTPLLGYPVWIDDDRFDLDYHVRRTSLPRPGDDEQLKRLAGRIMSQPLDRRRPLWEVWIVEGLEGNRFALVIKTHHCVIDGISGVDLLTALLRPTAEETFEAAPPWRPRPAPTPLQLLRDETGQQLSGFGSLARALEGRLRDPARIGAEVSAGATGVWEALRSDLHLAAPTPINQEIGPHRRCDWLGVDLDEVKAVKNRLGGTVNDVIVATVAGATRRFLSRRGVRLREIDFRATVPVSVRREEERGTLGNHVSAWLMSLPLHEANPLKRYARVRATTTHMKRSQHARGIEVLTEAAAAVDPFLTLGVRLASRLAPYNMVVSSVPGPPFPLYLLGAPMLAGYPMVPLFAKQGLAVGSFSHAGKLFWGCNADWDLLPDLKSFVEGLSSSFRELHAAAAPVQVSTLRPRRARPRSSTRPRVRVAS